MVTKKDYSAEEREILERDVFEKVNYLLESLGIK